MNAFVAIAINVVATLGLAADIARAEPSKDPLAYSLNDVPKEFTATPARQDFTKRTEMISMRDGVKLYTVIVVPKGAHDAPILLSRTPYNVEFYEAKPAVDRLLKSGYIRVFQDVRGKYGSEGNYVTTLAAARAAESDEGRSLDRHLGHDRLAGEEHAGVERSRRHDRFVVRGIHDGNGAPRSSPGAEGGRAGQVPSSMRGWATTGFTTAPSAT